MKCPKPYTTCRYYRSIKNVAYSRKPRCRYTKDADNPIPFKDCPVRKIRLLELQREYFFTKVAETIGSWNQCKDMASWSRKLAKEVIDGKPVRKREPNPNPLPQGHPQPPKNLKEGKR